MTEHKARLYRAAMAVAKGNYSLREASELYSVPKSTIWDRVSGKISLYTAVSGPPKYLNNTEQEQLFAFLLKAADIGFPSYKGTSSCYRKGCPSIETSV